MNGFDRQGLVTTLMLLVMTLFVASGLPRIGAWQRRFQAAAIAAFVIALVVALVEIGQWWAAARP